MRESIKTGICFGFTSAIITTTGLMVGLYSSTNSRIIVISGILTIAVADAFSDALGIHISEEAKKDSKEKDVWTATIFTFLSKFLFALTFVVPVVFLPLSLAVLTSLIWGMITLTILSYFISKGQESSALRVISEHVLIAVLVIFIAHSMGHFIDRLFS